MIAVWLLIAILLSGQTQSAPVQAEPGVYVITMGPGDAPWEKYGHNMLWIHRPDRDLDVAWNWGVFDFAQKNFIFHFLQGRLIYWMEGFKAQPAIDYYLGDDRTIWIQELNLSPAQQDELSDFCLWNSREENKFYRYDYFLDNCSTRVRDAVDQTLLGQLKRRATTMPSDVTYRYENSRLVADTFILYAGTDFILGQPVDRKMSVWDEMFIPMRMRDRLNQMTIADDTGRQVPLVKKEILLHTSKRLPLRDRPPNWTGWFLLVGIIVGGVQAWLGKLALDERRRKKWFGLLAMLWCFIAGAAGWFLVYAWTGTDHLAVRDNENILQLSPLMLPLVLIIPLMLRGWRRADRIALVLAGLALGGCVLGLVMKILPSMNQVNWNFIALAVPANAGLFWSIWKFNTKEAAR